MIVMNWLFWGVMATFAQSIFEGVTQSMRLTRMSLPYLLGTIFAEGRSRAKVLGFGLHIMVGLLSTFVYVAIFHFWGEPTWWRGAGIGFAQAMLVLLVALPLLPELHPRMASERYGPSARRQLEPPGFIALNYGRKTPISIVLSHIIFGAVIGSFCRM